MLGKAARVSATDTSQFGRESARFLQTSGDICKGYILIWRGSSRARRVARIGGGISARNKSARDVSSSWCSEESVRPPNIPVRDIDARLSGKSARLSVRSTDDTCRGCIETWKVGKIVRMMPGGNVVLKEPNAT